MLKNFDLIFTFSAYNRKNLGNIKTILFTFINLNEKQK